MEWLTLELNNDISTFRQKRKKAFEMTNFPHIPATPLSQQWCTEKNPLISFSRHEVTLTKAGQICQQFWIFELFSS